MSATGTSVNPARSIGVGVFAGTDAIVQLWLFVVAPLLGAAIAGLTYPLLFGHGADAVAGSGLNFGGGRKGQFVPGSYEAQWNQGQNQAPQQGQQGGWGQPGAAWGGPPPQQWGQPAQQQPDPYSTPQAQPAPGQWGQPQPQQPGQPGQWGAPPDQQQPGQPGPGAPGHWGNPDGDDDGRTQVRRPDQP